MSGLNWEKARRSALWRHGIRMAKEERQAVNSALARGAKLATQPQLDYVRDLLKKNNRRELTQQEQDVMTARQASDMIKTLKST